jgi:RNA polymerase sigma-70 factor, ECF subfamily
MTLASSSPGVYSFDSIYDDYAPQITRYLERLTGSYETAEDLTQETFLKVFRSWEQLGAAANPNAWLFRVATNTAYDELRKRRRSDTMPLTDIHARTIAAAALGLSFEDADWLWVVMGRLPAAYRIPLILQSYAGYPVRDIAALLGCKEATIRSRLRRARMQFQAHYVV